MANSGGQAHSSVTRSSDVDWANEMDPDSQSSTQVCIPTFAQILSSADNWSANDGYVKRNSAGTKTDASNDEKAHPLMNLHHELTKLGLQLDNCVKEAAHMKNSIVPSRKEEDKSTQTCSHYTTGRMRIVLEVSITEQKDVSKFIDELKNINDKIQVEFESLAGDAHDKQGEEYHNKDDVIGDYVITIKDKNGSKVCVDTLVRSCLDGLHVKWVKLASVTGYVKLVLTTKEDLMTVNDALLHYLSNSGDRFEAIEVSVAVKTPYAIKTELFNEYFYGKLPFIEDDIINQSMAHEFFVENNPKWFRNSEDIHWVKLVKVWMKQATMYALDIKVKQSVINNVKRTKGLWKMSFGDLFLVRVKVITKSEACYRCLESGHKADGCQAENPRCRFCPVLHESWVCPLNARKELYRGLNPGESTSEKQDGSSRENQTDKIHNGDKDERWSA